MLAVLSCKVSFLA